MYDNDNIILKIDRLLFGKSENPSIENFFLRHSSHRAETDSAAGGSLKCKYE